MNLILLTLEKMKARWRAKLKDFGWEQAKEVGLERQWVFELEAERAESSGKSKASEWETGTGVGLEKNLAFDWAPQ